MERSASNPVAIRLDFRQGIPGYRCPRCQAVWFSAAFNNPRTWKKPWIEICGRCGQEVNLRK